MVKIIYGFNRTNYMELKFTNNKLLDMVWFLFGASISLFLCLIYKTHITNMFVAKYKEQTVQNSNVNGTVNILEILNNITRDNVKEQLDGEDHAGDGVSKDDDSIWKALLHCQNLRQKRLQMRCQRIYPGLDKLIINYREDQIYAMSYMIIINMNKLLLKPVFGTNDSSWITNLIEYTTGKKLHIKRRKHGDVNIHDIPNLEEYDVHILRDKLSQLNVVKNLDKYFSILTVKHPLVRLESVYGNPKLRDVNTDKEYREKRNKKKKKKRKKKRKRKRKKNTNRRRLLSEDAEESLSGNKQVVTVKEENHFEIFLDDLLTGKKKHNGYLAPFDDAFPCIIPYKYIAKEETVLQDMAYIVNTKLPKRGKFVKDDVKQILTSQQISSKQIPLPYFTSLSNPEIYLDKVMQIYGADMKLFGYSYNISTKTGQIYATCENYDDQINMCC